MSEAITVDCPDCGEENEIKEFFIRIAQTMGLKGVLCSDCGEQLPAELIEEELEE